MATTKLNSPDSPGDPKNMQKKAENVATKAVQAATNVIDGLYELRNLSNEAGRANIQWADVDFTDTDLRHIDAELITNVLTNGAAAIDEWETSFRANVFLSAKG